MAKPPWEPTELQQKFVETFFEVGSIRKACETVGCSREVYYKNWRKNENFTAYFDKYRRELAGARLPIVDASMFKKAAGGDVNAARLVYEVFGGLRNPQVQVNNNIQAPEGEPGKKIAGMLDEIEKKTKLHAVK